MNSLDNDVVFRAVSVFIEWCADDKSNYGYKHGHSGYAIGKRVTVGVKTFYIGSKYWRKECAKQAANVYGNVKDREECLDVTSL